MSVRFENARALMREEALCVATAATVHIKITSRVSPVGRLSSDSASSSGPSTSGRNLPRISSPHVLTAAQRWLTWASISRHHDEPTLNTGKLLLISFSVDSNTRRAAVADQVTDHRDGLKWPHFSVRKQGRRLESCSRTDSRHHAAMGIEHDSRVERNVARADD